MICSRLSPFHDDDHVLLVAELLGVFEPAAVVVAVRAKQFGAAGAEAELRHGQPQRRRGGSPELKRLHVANVRILGRFIIVVRNVYGVSNLAKSVDRLVKRDSTGVNI